jgi:hypothetical protein
MAIFKRCCFVVLCSILLFPCKVLPQDSEGDEEAITVITYYPSPHGDYYELRAGRLSVGDNYRSPSEYCWSGGGCNQHIGDEADLVVEGNVGIGTVAPQATRC